MVAILGLSAFYHDSAAALIVDGDIVAAAQEERFSRKKHDPGYPRNAVDYVLAEAGIGLAEVDHVAFYDKPFLKFERLLETFVATLRAAFGPFAPPCRSGCARSCSRRTCWRGLLSEHDGGFDARRLLFAEHHFSHAASAFYPSPFEEALVLTLDGVGEWATGTVAIGRGRNLEIIKEMRFPHSLGLLYSAFTYYVGFKVNSGEYKLMGLAPYGVPRFKDLILERLLDLKEDGVVPARHELLQLSHRAGDDRQEVRAAVRHAGTQARKRVAHRLPHGRRRLDPGSDRRDHAAHGAQPGGGASDGEPLPRRGRCAQLRGERQAAARRRLPRHLDPARLRRRRRFGRRGARGAWHAIRARALGQSARCNEGRVPGARYSQREISRALRKAGAVFEELPTEAMLEPRRRRLPRGRRSDGSRVAWSSARGRSARGRSSATRGRTACRRTSTSR